MPGREGGSEDKARRVSQWTGWHFYFQISENRPANASLRRVSFGAPARQMPVNAFRTFCLFDTPEAEGRGDTLTTGLSENLRTEAPKSCHGIEETHKK